DHQRLPSFPTRRSSDLPRHAPRCTEARLVISAPMIEARGLRKRYGEIVAVDDLSFAIEPGETFALIGPNGAGKTTTLKLLLGLRSEEHTSELQSRFDLV